MRTSSWSDFDSSFDHIFSACNFLTRVLVTSASSAVTVSVIKQRAAPQIIHPNIPMQNAGLTYCGSSQQ
jgi:hypothetical protein